MKRIHDFGWFRVRWLAGYGWIVDRRPAVVVVPLAPDGRVWLAQIARPPTKTISWECPGGEVGKKEPIVAAGLRELEEECGLYPRGRVRLVPTPVELAPGMGRFPHHVVVARRVVPRGERPSCQQAEGILNVECFTQQKVRTLIKRGEIAVPATLAALAVSGWL